MSASSCVSRTNALHVLRQSCVLIRSQKNRKENEHVENLVFVVAAAVQPLLASQCCSQHRRTAARNPEICRRKQAYGCRTIGVKQALEMICDTYLQIAICYKKRTFFRANMHHVWPVHAYAMQISMSKLCKM